MSRPPIRFVLPRREYLCSDSLRLTVLVETKAVRLTLSGKIYGLQQVDSANGLKFSAGSVSWLTDDANNNGILQDNTDPANPKALAKGCRLRSTYPPVGSPLRTVTGTVSSNEHVVVPAEAILVVQLQDVTHPAGTPPTVAKSESKVGDRRLPIAFALSFDPAKIDPTHSYAVAASILLDGQLLFANDTLYPVLTQGYPAKKDVTLKSVADRPIP